MADGPAATRATQRDQRYVVLVVAGSCLLEACSTTNGAPGRPPPQTAPTAGVASPDALPRLEASVESIGEGAKGLHQHNLSRVLRQLGGGMQPISPATSLRLREVAQRLDQSPPGLLTHTRLLKEGFSVLLDGLLAARVPTGDQARYRRALLAFDEASAAVHEIATFSEQADAIKAALRAATDAVFLARAHTPPFDQAAALSSPQVAVGSLQTELDQALASVSELADADWMSSRRAASRALADLADVVEAADGGERFGAQIDEARFQAERLSRSETRDFSHGKWLKAGLTRVLDAWDELDWGGGNPAPVWGRSARTAVDAIDERGTLSFQRGVIQDAFRTTLTAFVAAAEAANACSDGNAEARPAAHAAPTPEGRP